MITEIAHITINPSDAEEFETAVAQAVPAFRSAEGCHGMSLEHVIEDPAQYRLLVQWESVDHHMVIFRQSAAFKIWRDLASPFFMEAPRVEHSETVSRYF